MEWADYVCHFEQVSIWNKWSESEKAAQLAMSLRGSQRMLGDLTRGSQRMLGDQLTNYESKIGVNSKIQSDETRDRIPLRVPEPETTPRRDSS